MALPVGLEPAAVVPEAIPIFMMADLGRSKQLWTLLNEELKS